MQAHKQSFRFAIDGPTRERGCFLQWQKTRRKTATFAWTFLWMVACCPAQIRQTEANQIQLEITGLRSDRGQLLCALFSSPDDFPRRPEKAVARAKSAITNRHGTCEFNGISPGTYAISVIHDENSNGKLDSKLMGIPREGVGASNDAKGHFGPPKFDAAAFRYSGGRLEMKITISYL